MIELLGSIGALVLMILKHLYDPNRLRGKALDLKKEIGIKKQEEIDNAIVKKDYKSLSIILQHLHDSRRNGM